MPLDTVVVGGEYPMVVDATAGSGAEMREILNLIDARLPIDLREPYLKMRAGAAVPKARREMVREAIEDILDNPGTYNDQRASASLEEPEPDDLLDPDEQGE